MRIVPPTLEIRKLVKRIRSHKRFYLFFFSVLIPSIFLLKCESLLVLIGLIGVDEYVVMGHGLKIRDIINIFNNKGEIEPTHEFIMTLIFIVWLLCKIFGLG